MAEPTSPPLSDPAHESPAECERCGRCLQVCPSYAARLIETFGPRGRCELADAALSGKDDATADALVGERFRQVMEACLQCGACRAACPKGVDVPSKIARARALAGSGPAWERPLIRLLTGHRKVLAAGLRLARLAAPLLPRRTQTPEQAPIRHLPLFLPTMLSGRRVPELSPRPLTRLAPERSPADPRAPFRGTVQLFAGCWFGLAQPGPALDAIFVLNRLGWEVHTPAEQACCGAPAMLGGHFDAAEKAAERACRSYRSGAGKTPVLTLCATCHGALSRMAPLAGRVLDAGAFLAEQDDWPALPPANISVSVHDPCHLRGQEPAVRTLLARAGYAITELSEPGACCGGSGLAGLKNPELSGRLGRAKAESVLAAGADHVAAACPGCLLQIDDWLSRLPHAGAAPRAVHPISLAARRLREIDHPES